MQTLTRSSYNYLEASSTGQRQQMHSNLHHRSACMPMRSLCTPSRPCMQADACSSRTVAARGYMQRGALQEQQHQSQAQACSRQPRSRRPLQPPAALRLPPVPAGAAVGGAAGELYDTLAMVLEAYMAVLTVRVALSWFPNISWYKEPFKTLKQFTDPVLYLFRGAVPAILGMDLSSLLVFFLLGLAKNTLRRMATGA